MNTQSGAGRFIAGLRHLVPVLLVACWIAAPQAAKAANPWDNDPAVQEVLKLRQVAIKALITTGPTPETDRYSSTFVANTPGGGVVNGAQMQAAFAKGSVKYAEVEMKLEYAGSHGPDIVVLMGEEIVVPGAGARNAGERIRRRFTDIFRKEAGEWRHDVRHSSVIPAK